MGRHTAFKIPPITENSDSEPRRVGFELEFSGIGLDETADAVAAALDAEIRSETEAEKTVCSDHLGEFRIHLDWNFLQRKAEQHREEGKDDEWIGQLGRVAALVVPVEVVCPPIPISELDRLDPMTASLRQAGAVGTEESIVAAYGVHVNCEIPRLDAATIHSYLRSYVILQWWLVDASEIDSTRRISPYVDLYPEVYMKQVLSQDEPDMDRLFADYLEHNDTRNRALDLLPLLAEIDRERVGRALDDPKIRPRPAFHYRLPNCHIEREEWSLAESWNMWWLVEELADRPEALDELGAAFLEANRFFIGVNRKKWVETVDRWLKKNELA